MSFQKVKIVGFEKENDTGTIGNGALWILIRCTSSTSTIAGMPLAAGEAELCFAAPGGTTLDAIPYDASSAKIKVWEMRYSSII